MQVEGKSSRRQCHFRQSLIVALEVFLARMIFENKKAAAVMIWWVLILIYASLRFDDGIHVASNIFADVRRRLAGRRLADES